MNPKSTATKLAGAFCLALAVAAGCNKIPMAPARSVALSVTLSRLDSVRASLLGTAQNEILFHLNGTGDPAGHGIYGPFSAPASTGSVSFTVQVPYSPGPQVLSLQLNDANSHQPLALGATAFDFGTGLASGGLMVEMGSVTRNCYFTDESRNPGANNPYNAGSAYTFNTDTLVPGTTLGGPDIAFDCPLGPYLMEEAVNAVPTADSIAYMGNGDMVDYDGVPPGSGFFPYSTQSKAALGAPVSTLQAGDVYCVKAGSLKGGYAWVQITDPGLMYSTGPSFRFRVNTTFQYYAYQQTAADLPGGVCSPNW
jgi:hypothetical protein